MTRTQNESDRAILTPSGKGRRHRSRPTRRRPRRVRAAAARRAAPAPPPRRRRGAPLPGPNFLQNSAKFCRILKQICIFLAGSFSAVSKRHFARKYAFGSIFQALKDVHPFAPLQSQNFRKKNRFEKTAIFVKIQQNFANVAKFPKYWQISKISA